MVQEVILVDAFDEAIGACEKMKAHQEGLLHRAFSAFVFNSQGLLMLQQRAFSKYHSGGLWTNTCCSHPGPGEELEESVLARLLFEMGLKCRVQEKFSFLYKAEMERGLIEHEYDHVFFGYTDDEPKLNPDEAASWKMISPENLTRAIAAHPEQFTAWLRICWPKVLEQL